MDNEGAYMLVAPTLEELLVKLARLRLKEKDAIAKPRSTDGAEGERLR